MLLWRKLANGVLKGKSVSCIWQIGLLLRSLTLEGLFQELLSLSFILPPPLLLLAHVKVMLLQVSDVMALSELSGQLPADSWHRPGT